MSKPRYDWWSYAKGMIRRYPQLKQEYEELHTSSMIADYSGNPHGSGASRTTECIALRELPTTSQREYEAVRRAIETTKQYKNGRQRMQIVQLVFWKRSHTIEGAAQQIPCSEITARRWHGDFIRMVAKFYGLMDN